MGKKNEPVKEIFESLDLEGLTREDFLSIDDLLRILPISRPTLSELDGLPVTRIGKRNFVLKPLFYQWLREKTECLEMEKIEIPETPQVGKDWIQKRIDFYVARYSKNKRRKDERKIQGEKFSKRNTNHLVKRQKVEGINI